MTELSYLCCLMKSIGGEFSTEVHGGGALSADFLILPFVLKFQSRWVLSPAIKSAVIEEAAHSSFVRE